jgi:hypothetical protein
MIGLSEFTFLGLRAYSLLFFPIFLFPVSAGGPNSVPVGAPKSPSPSENPMPQIKFKSEAPENGAPKVFFFFPVSARGPKGPKVPKNVRPQNLKLVAPNVFFVPCFSAGSKQRGARKSPRPQKRSHKIKKREAQKAGPQKMFLFLLWTKRLQKARPKKA